MGWIPLGSGYYLSIGGGGDGPSYACVMQLSASVVTVTRYGMVREGWPGLPEGVACRACWWVESTFPHLPLSGFEDRRTRLRLDHPFGDAGEHAG
jgi:hypothetical protein